MVAITNNTYKRLGDPDADNHGFSDHGLPRALKHRPELGEVTRLVPRRRGEGLVVLDKTR